MEADTASIYLEDLPQSVITSVLEVLLHQTNPSQILKLAVCSKQLYARISNAEGLWKRTCESVGWHTKQAQSYINVPQDDDMKWFTYYLIRMRVRWRVRRLMKLYIPFLPRMCSMNIMPGASVATLASVEQHLGAKLHWELWEMLRFRGGQAPGSGAYFAEDARMLMPQELTLQTVTVTRSAFFEPGAAAAPAGSIPEEVQQAGNELLAAAPGHTLELQLVRFAASSSGVRSFGVSASGEVFKTTGVTTTMAARSTAAFLQKLLT